MPAATTTKHPARLADMRPMHKTISLQRMHTSSSDSMPNPSSDPISSRCARARLGSIVIIAALTAALLSACGSSSSTPSTSSTATGSTTKTILNTHRIELSIQRSILIERHIHAKVFCPRVVPQQAGRDFACIATTGKIRTPFAVVQQNNSGYVTYRAE
jgi:hypothetical protein